MITLELQRLCRLRGIVSPYSFLRQAGFSHNLAHNLASSKVKSIGFAHLERLCRLFNCMPQELFTYKPSGRGLNPATDVLLPLRKDPARARDLNSLIASLPPEALIDLTTQIHDRYHKPSGPPAEEPAAQP